MIKYHFNNLTVNNKYLIENSMNPSKLEIFCKKNNSIEELELELGFFLNI